MNVKTQSINPSTIGLMLRRPFSALVLAVTLPITGLFIYSGKANQQVTLPAISAYTPSTYGVEFLELTSPTTGKAVIKLDDLTVNVSFILELVPSTHGVYGSEYNEVYVQELFVDRIVNESGDEYTDFTTSNDHFNINQLIVAHLYKNKLVEGV
ncbi:hypothetical protein [Acinetobacter rudis]|uniref:hypothetical protein n=1 Tax=Acinetobacter rudis TaxID=632955 RepID=UPI00333F0C12